MELTTPLTIRRVERNDLQALEWNGAYSHFRRLYHDIYQSSVRGEAVMWIAELPDAGIIGQLFVQLVSGRAELADGSSKAYIYAFRVQSLYQRQGIGSKLLSAAEEDLESRGFLWVCLNVGQNNIYARRLYERHGYDVVADEPGRWSFLDENGQKQDVHEPAWRMEKALVSKGLLAFR